MAADNHHLSFRQYLSDEIPSAEALQMVATGRGALSFILGDAPQRYQLFRDNIQWQHVLLAFSGTTVVGFAAYQRFGRGPYAPRWADFIRVFGWFDGPWRALLFWLIEYRTLFSPFYLYGLKVDVKARRRGIASQLVQNIEVLAQAATATTVELEVKDSNDAAIQLYRSQGYVLLKKRGTGLLAKFLSFHAVYVFKKSLPPKTP